MRPRQKKEEEKTAFYSAVACVLFAFLLAPFEPAYAQDITCENWCALLSDHCPEEVLHNEDFCLDYCNHPYLDILPAGTAGDTSGNTLACRIEHAEAAGSATGATREALCAAAAMSGGDTCGSYCDVYCHLALETCNTTNNPPYGGTELFLAGGNPNIMQCRTACQGYPEDVLDGISQTDQLFGYGDSVQCRLHHLEAAVVEGQGQTSAYGLHCGHASPGAANDLCSDNAEPNIINYCVFARYHCAGDEAIVADGTSQSDCVSSLRPFVDDGFYEKNGFASFADTDTNSVGCLNNRIMLAALDSTTYCGEGQIDPAFWIPDGAGVCVAPSSEVPTGHFLPTALSLLIMAIGVPGLVLHRRRRNRPI